MKLKRDSDFVLMDSDTWLSRLIRRVSSWRGRNAAADNAAIRYGWSVSKPCKLVPPAKGEHVTIDGKRYKIESCYDNLDRFGNPPLDQFARFSFTAHEDEL